MRERQNTMGVMFDRSTIEGEIAVLQALVDQVKEKKGNAAKRLAEATWTALDERIDVNGDDSPIAGFSGLLPVDTEGTVRLGDLATYVHALDQWAEQQANEAVQAIVRKAGNVDNVDALVEQYRSGVEKVKAMITLAKGFDVDTKGLEIPALRGGSVSTGSQSRRSTSAKRQLFYRLLPGGERRDQSENQNSLSSMAWYYGAKIVGVEQGSSNKGRGVTAKELEEYLRKNIDGFSLGKNWYIEAGDTTYGMDVVEPSADDQAGEEE